ncbi:hypothetical protein CR513_06421, partial [Mucuna pruriens]
MNKRKVYIALITLLLASTGIKYGGSDNNPFRQSTPTMSVFLTATFCHFLASSADMNLQATIITFHVSGIVACETLLWILLAQILWYSIVNILVLVVASICFFNYIANIINQLLSHLRSNVDRWNGMQNAKPQPEEDQEYLSRRTGSVRLVFIVNALFCVLSMFHVGASSARKCRGGSCLLSQKNNV